MVTVRGKNAGVSAIGAVLAILIFTLFISVIVSLVTTGASIGLQEEIGMKAFYVAEAGLQYALEAGTLPCNFDVAAPVSIGGGSFTVASRCVSSAGACSAPATVTDNPLGAPDTDINVTSVANYVVPGTIRIDDEYILCTSTVANQFNECVRGRAGSAAVPHANGTTVTQCTVTSTGTYSAGVFFGDVKRTVQTSIGQ
jgi:hypothetical protein